MTEEATTPQQYTHSLKLEEKAGFENKCACLC
jgi:hypothetical protein